MKMFAVLHRLTSALLHVSKLSMDFNYLSSWCHDHFFPYSQQFDVLLVAKIMGAFDAKMKHIESGQFLSDFLNGWYRSFF